MLGRREQHLALGSGRACAQPSSPCSSSAWTRSRASIRPLPLAGDVHKPATCAIALTLPGVGATRRAPARRRRRRSATPRRIRAESLRFRHTRRSPPRGALPAPRRARRSSPRRDPARGAAFRRARRARHDGREPRRTQPSGTRKIAPDDALSALGPVGSAQPEDSAMNAGPSPSAARTSVPMLPGSAALPEASPTGGGVRVSSRGRSSRRRQRSLAAGGRAPRLPRARLDELAAGETLNEAFPVQQEMDWLEPGRERRLDEIFALTTEQSRAVALAAGREPADEPKPRVRRRGDHSGASSHSSHWPWKPACASRSSSPSGRSLAQRPQWPCSPGLGRAVRDRPAGTGGRPPRAQRRSGRDPPCPGSR